jgi:hypothetical protein
MPLLLTRSPASSLARTITSAGSPRHRSTRGGSFRVAASVSQGERETIAMDEDQASAGAQSAPIALLHSRKATVTLPLSRSMLSGGATSGDGAPTWLPL